MGIKNARYDWEKQAKLKAEAIEAPANSMPYRAQYIEKTHEKGTPLLMGLCTHGLNMGHLV